MSEIVRATAGGAGSLIGWPFLRGYGRRVDVPSALQRNYAHGLLAYVGVIWVLAVVATIVDRRRKGTPTKEEAR